MEKYTYDEKLYFSENVICRLEYEKMPIDLCEEERDIITVALVLYQAMLKTTHRGCDECKNYGWDMPQCRDCNSENGYKYFRRKYNDNE